jgi:type IV secretion system protein VirB2
MAGAVFLATISNAFATGTGGFPWDGAIIQLQSDLIPSTSRNATSNV